MKLQFDFKPYFKLTNPFAGRPYELLKGSLLAIMMRQKDKVFKSQTTPDGQPWQKLSPLTESLRRKGPKASRNPNQILSDTGMMKNSITFAGAPHSVNDTTGDKAELGTNVPYAKVHQFGAVIVPKNPAGVLVIPNGNHPVFLKRARIPARPFMGFGQKDEEPITEKIQAFVEKQVRFER